GLLSAVHQPVRRMSPASRHDVTNSPNVGTVHKMARSRAIPEAHGEVSLVFASTARCSALVSLRGPDDWVGFFAFVWTASTSMGWGALLLIAAPPRVASGGRCRRGSV